MEIKTEDSFHDIRDILGLADDTECYARWQTKIIKHYEICPSTENLQVLSSLNITVLRLKTFSFG